MYLHFNISKLLFFKKRFKYIRICKYFYLVIFLLFVYSLSGQYKSITKFIGSSSFYKIGLRNILSISFLFLIYNLLKGPTYVLNDFLLLAFFSTFLVTLSRFLIKDLIRIISVFSEYKLKRIIIYGAGEAGTKLAAALRLSPRDKIITFVDDRKELWFKKVDDIPVTPLHDLYRYKGKFDVFILQCLL